MATNEELEQKFGKNLCFFFSHEFVQKHLRLVETQVIPIEGTTAESSNAERVSIATTANASLQDDSFKTAVSDVEPMVISNTAESIDVGKNGGILTTSIECVESPESSASNEQSDDNSPADKSVFDVEVVNDTSSEQTGKSSREPSSNELLDANAINDSIETVKVRYNTRNRSKKESQLNDSRLKEVQELALNLPKQETSNRPNYMRKKIKLHQPNKALGKDFVSLIEDDDSSADMSDDNDEDAIDDSSKKRVLTGKAKKYDYDEDHNILKFIFNSGRFSETKGNLLWKDMQKSKVNFPRPWQSMKERFRKHIATKLSLYTHMYKLNQDLVDKLQNNVGRTE